MSLIVCKHRRVPPLRTAALPDLIFVVLFFFIMVTRMREVTLKVKYRVPVGTELTKLTKKSAVTYIYIGQPVKPMQSSGGTETRIQINDKFADIPAVTDYVADERKHMSPEDARIMSVSVKADRATRMGIISDVKEALRQAGAFRINYSAVSEGEKVKK